MTVRQASIMPSKEEYASGHILVKFKPGTSAEDRQRTHKRHGGRVIEVLPKLDVQVVQVPRGSELTVVAAYLREPQVEFAELDYRVDAAATPERGR